MSRDPVWRGGCPAAAVPDGEVGSVGWFGLFSLRNRWGKFKASSNDSAHRQIFVYLIPS